MSATPTKHALWLSVGQASAPNTGLATDGDACEGGVGAVDATSDTSVSQQLVARLLHAARAEMVADAGELVSDRHAPRRLPRE